MLAAPTAATTADKAEADDEVDISPEAQIAAALAEGPWGAADANGCISIASLQAEQEEARAAVASKLHELFREQGIDTSQEIRLQVAGDGSVAVANDHPQRAQIEQLFRDDPQLRNDFVKYVALTETIAAANEAVAFQQAYAKNPQAAVEQWWYLFDSAMSPTVSVSIRGDEFKAFQQRPGGKAQVVDE